MKRKLRKMKNDWCKNLKYIGSVSRSEPDENAFDQFLCGLVVLRDGGAVERSELFDFAVVTRSPGSFIRI